MIYVSTVKYIPIKILLCALWPLWTGWIIMRNENENNNNNNNKYIWNKRLVVVENVYAITGIFGRHGPFGLAVDADGKCE